MGNKYHIIAMSVLLSGLIFAIDTTRPAWSQAARETSLLHTRDQASINHNLSFDRLFTTPEQRKALDLTRRNGGLTHPQITGVNESATDSSTKEITRVNQPVKLSGVLLRADGQHQIWVSGGNGKRENPNFNNKILGSILQSANVKVPLQGTNQAAILKPGQVWRPDNNRAEESYRIPVVNTPSVSEPETKLTAAPMTSAVSSGGVQSSASSSEVHSSVQSSTK